MTKVRKFGFSRPMPVIFSPSRLTYMKNKETSLVENESLFLLFGVLCVS